MHRNILAIIPSCRGRAFLERAIESIDNPNVYTVATTTGYTSKFADAVIQVPQLAGQCVPPPILRRIAEDAFARDLRWKHVMYVDDDCILQSGTVDNMVDILDEFEEVGQVGGAILHNEETESRWPMNFTEVPNQEDFFVHTENPEPDGHGLTHVSHACGGCSMVRASLLRDMRVWGHDPGYGAGWEDIDFSWMIKRAGYDIVMRPDIKAIHDERGAMSCWRRLDDRRRSEAHLWRKWKKIGVLCWNAWKLYPEFADFDFSNPASFDMVRDQIKKWAESW